MWRRSERGRIPVPRGLLAACMVAALLVAVPVIVTIVQAVQGGLSVAGTSIGSTSTLTLGPAFARGCGRVSADLRRHRCCRRLVRRTHHNARPAPVGGAPGGAADDSAVRYELRVGELRPRIPGICRRGGNHLVQLLPDRVSACRGGASRPRPGARGDRAFARVERAQDVLQSRAAAAEARDLRRDAVGSARLAGRVRRLCRAQIPDLLLRRVRPVPARFQCVRRGCALVRLDCTVRGTGCSARRSYVVTPITRASAKELAGWRILTGSGAW